MNKKNMAFTKMSLSLVAILFVIGLVAIPAHAQVVFYEDFKDGWGDWWASNGQWEVGNPTTGPEECYNGSSLCAATKLDDNYVDNNESRLISPYIQLPSIGVDEEIHLRFQHWASFGSYDAGRVQISYETAPGEWSAWETLASYSNSSGAWAYPVVDLTSYAGEKIRIAFWIDQGNSGWPNYHSYVGLGWYIDDVLIETRSEVTVDLPFGGTYKKDFEDDWRDWWASNGQWEVGNPTTGPEECYAGSSLCAATKLDGNYADNNESRLISPYIQLPALGEIYLRFRHWASFGSYDAGRVQISYETSPGEWSAWETRVSYSNSSGDWAYPLVDLTSYAGDKIRVAFWIDQGNSGWPNYSSYVGLGWYIDNVLIVSKGNPAVSYYCDHDKDGKFSTSITGTCSGVDCEPAGCQPDPGDDCNDNDKEIYPGADESCNGKDDNCDGSVDESLTRATTCGVGECAGNVGKETCTAGVWGNDTCDAFAGATSEVCDNKDNDCDGSVDENLTRTTTCGVGECAGNKGEETCTAGAWGNDTCDPFAGATSEVCDNRDNDCDGSVDENLTRTTTCGVGECEGNKGEETCTAGAWGNDTCDPLAGAIPEGPPGDLTCEDGKDNDCDDLTDNEDVSDCIGIDGPSLEIPENIPAAQGDTVPVTVLFNGDGQDIASTAFSVDVDEECMTFNDEDSDKDGIPDVVTFDLPEGFDGSVTYDGNDKDGELDFLIADAAAPAGSLPDGAIVTIDFRVKCHTEGDLTRIVPVDFSSDPEASFGSSEGVSIAGSTFDGSIEIWPPVDRGDCNADGTVNAADILSCALEIFDGDGSEAKDAPEGEYPGNSVGCDSNEDTFIDAADIVCTGLILFDGQGACGSGGSTNRLNSMSAASVEGYELLDSQQTGEPELDIPGRFEASPDGTVVVPVHFTSNGHDIASIAFSIDYDEKLLTADSNGDGIPDNVNFSVPAGLNASVSFNADDKDGELDILIADTFPPFATLDDGAVVTVELTVKDTSNAAEAAVNFSNDPVASFGNTSGESVAGIVDDGSVLISGNPAAEADLLITSVSKPPKSKKRGKKFTVKTTVKNIGEEEAGKSMTRFYLSKNRRIDRKDIRIKGSRTYPELSAGEHSKKKAKLRIPKKTRPGKYYLIACTDDRYNVSESNEENNCRIAKRKIRVKK